MGDRRPREPGACPCCGKPYATSKDTRYPVALCKCLSPWGRWCYACSHCADHCTCEKTGDEDG